MKPYQKTQFGYVTTISLLTAIGFVAWLSTLYRSHWVVLVIMALLALCLLLFPSLTVRVTDRELKLWFGPGLIRKTIPLSRITAVKKVVNPWYFGWGIRLTPHGWLYNVSGLQAVELELEKGRTMRVGTPDPEALSAALQSRLAPR